MRKYKFYFFPGILIFCFTVSNLFCGNHTSQYFTSSINGQQNLFAPFDSTVNSGWVVYDHSGKFHLSCIDYSDENNIFIGGIDAADLKTGVLMYSTNAGSNWQFMNLKKPAGSIFFSNPSTGYIGGMDGMLYKTINGGADWSEILPVMNFSISSLYFLDENTGYAAGGNTKGDHGFVYFTSDGGTTWKDCSPNTGYGLHSVFFANQNTGYISGVGGIIRKTTDAGNTWKLSQVMADYAFTSLAFLNSETGFAVGGNQNGTKGLILMTTNGGENWKIQVMGAALNKIIFINSDIGYITGLNGLILRTSNGGIDWIKQESNITENLFAIDFINTESGWAIGMNNTVLKTSTGGK